MVPKRHLHGEGGSDFTVPFRESKRRPLFKNAVGDVIRNLSVNEALWEPFLRRVVRDEVERAICSCLHNQRAPIHSAGTSGGRCFQLRFVGKLPSPIFTGHRIEAEDTATIQVHLIDAGSQSIVKSGLLSSMKVEILPLDGDFGSDDQEDWSENQFNDRIVREREGKRPLITGELIIQLREGVGYIGDISFTDNSSWLRSRKFRLGARVPQKNSSAEVRIREARSEPFIVKDHRGESYKKHHPPSLNDDVWRLEKIAKDGASHKKLASYKIYTVKDFLQFLVRDPASLRNIFGGVSDRNWKTIIGHAMNCVVDDNKFYTYHRPGQDVSLLLNSIYKVIGAMFDDQYCSLDELTPSHKILVENLKQHAYKNLNHLVPVDELAIAGLSRPFASLQAEPFNEPNPDLQHIDFHNLQQDQPMLQLGFSQSITPSYTCEAECSNQMVAENNYPLQQVFNPILRNSFSMGDFFPAHYNEEPNWCPIGSPGPVFPSGNSPTETFLQFHTPTFPPMTATWGQSNGILFASSEDDDDAETGIFPPFPRFGERKPKAGWCKIRAAIKCWLSVRLAARRMSKANSVYGLLEL